MTEDSNQLGSGDPPDPDTAEPVAGRWASRVRELGQRVASSPGHRFVLLFLPYLAVAALLYPVLARRFPYVIQGFILMTARIEAGLFSLFSDQVELREKLVVYGPFTVQIIDECTGLFEMVIFSAAVWAFPASWRDRALGLLIGNPMIYLFNVVRIAGLIWVGRHQPALFEFMHLYFWQATMVAMIAAVWLVWLNKVVGRVRKNDWAAA